MIVTRSRLTWRRQLELCTIASAMSSATSGSDVGVDRVGALLITVEAHQRELVGVHHARRDLEHADRLTGEFEAQHSDQACAANFAAL